MSNEIFVLEKLGLLNQEKPEANMEATFVFENLDECQKPVECSDFDIVIKPVEDDNEKQQILNEIEKMKHDLFVKGPLQKIPIVELIPEPGSEKEKEEEGQQQQDQPVKKSRKISPASFLFSPKEDLEKEENLEEEKPESELPVDVMSLSPQQPTEESPVPISEKPINYLPNFETPFMMKDDTELLSKLPTKQKKIQVPSSPYYMQNRQLFIDKINKIMEPFAAEYRTSVAEVSCDADKTGEEFSLLTHQRLVREYLNIYSPYRGLLLYHGMGSGKTCSSIAIAEGMKSNKQIIVMTKASLESNFYSEMQKCGDDLYKKHQWWKFVDTTIAPHSSQLPKIAEALNISQQYIQEQGGVWLADSQHDGSNYDELDTDPKIHLQKKKQLDTQIDNMIKAKYMHINIDGLRNDAYRKMSSDGRVNIFDNKVIIIDEAHNLASMISNKMSQKGSLSLKLYNALMSAENCKIVCLSGTPMINHPNEVAILFNILRGYIKTWTLPLQEAPNVIAQQQQHQETHLTVEKVTSVLSKKGLIPFDWVELDSTGKHLVITRNPFGFINVTDQSLRKMFPAGRGTSGEGEEEEEEEQTTVEYKDIKPSPVHTTRGKTLRARKEGGKRNIRKTHKNVMGGLSKSINTGEVGYESAYRGMILNEMGQIDDRQFIELVVNALEEAGILVNIGGIMLDYYTCLPDRVRKFESQFFQNGKLKNVESFIHRILGLVSYFRSVQEDLLPEFHYVSSQITASYKSIGGDQIQDLDNQKEEIDIVDENEINENTFPEDENQIDENSLENKNIKNTFPEDENEIDENKNENTLPEEEEENQMEENVKMESSSSPYHLYEVLVDMSEYQFALYEKSRKEERTDKKESKNRFEGIEKVNGSYRVFSRAICNFAMPPFIERPQKAQKHGFDATLPSTNILPLQATQYGGEEKEYPVQEEQVVQEQEPVEEQVVQEEEQEPVVEEPVEEEQVVQEEEQEPVEEEPVEEQVVQEEEQEPVDEEPVEEQVVQEEEPVEEEPVEEEPVEEEQDDENGYDGLSAEQRLEENQDAQYEADDIYREKRKDKSLDEGGLYKQHLQETIVKLKQQSANVFTRDKLATYSPKFLKVLELLDEKDEKGIAQDDRRGLHLIYSQFRTLEGIGILRMVLEQNGYRELLVEQERSGEWKIKGIDDPEFMQYPHFMVYLPGNDEKTKIAREYLRLIYNSEWHNLPISLRDQLENKFTNNHFGEVVKIMMITAAGAEGINLKNTRFVHIIEPYWHPTRTEQIIARARRICSHASLPVEYRNVRAYIYMSKIPETILRLPISKDVREKDVSKRDPLQAFTSDQTLYEISQMKGEIINQILDVIKSASIDCQVFNKDPASGYKCYNLTGAMSNSFLLAPNLSEIGENKQKEVVVTEGDRDIGEGEKQEEEEEKRELKPVEENLVSYDIPLNQKTKVLFDNYNAKKDEMVRESGLDLPPIQMGGKLKVYYDKINHLMYDKGVASRKKYIPLAKFENKQFYNPN